MLFTETKRDPPPNEAAYRRSFEDWLANMPAEFRHRNSIVYRGRGQIYIRPIVSTPSWWVVRLGNGCPHCAGDGWLYTHGLSGPERDGCPVDCRGEDLGRVEMGDGDPG